MELPGCWFGCPLFLLVIAKLNNLSDLYKDLWSGIIFVLSFGCLGGRFVSCLSHSINTSYCAVQCNTEYGCKMNWTTGKDVWLTPEAPEYLRPLNKWGPPDEGLWICGAPFLPGGWYYCNNPLVRGWFSAAYGRLTTCPNNFTLAFVLKSICIYIYIQNTV